VFVDNLLTKRVQGRRDIDDEAPSLLSLDRTYWTSANVRRKREIQSQTTLKFFKKQAVSSLPGHIGQEFELEF